MDSWIFFALVCTGVFGAVFAVKLSMKRADRPEAPQVDQTETHDDPQSELWPKIKKRLADALEKFAVGSLLIGLYQQNSLAMFLGGASFIICLHLSRRL